MAVTTIFSNALSGLTLNQLALATTSHNVANANTEGYSRQTIQAQPRVTAGRGNGVELAGITRQVDTILQKNLRDHTSDLGLAEVRDQFFGHMQDLFGSTDGESLLTTDLTSFTSAVESLGNNPESAGLRFTAVAAAQVLAQNVRSMAGTIQDLRRQADQNIKTAVDVINQNLDFIQKVNGELSRARALGESTSELEDQRDRAVQLIAEQIDVSTFTREDGSLAVSTRGGVTLLDSRVRRLAYSPAATLDSDSVFSALTVTAFDADGNAIGAANTLVSGGTSDTVSSDLVSGRIKGLLNARDGDLNAIAKQLDAFAGTLRDEINAIHNDGVGFPAANLLTGTRDVASSTAFSGTGTVRIAVVDGSGTIVGTPFDLDLGALGATTVGTVAALIDAGLGADGTAVVSDGKLLIGASDAANGIAINEIDSAESATGRGFSHFFGLNDLFVGSNAVALDVNARILADPSAFSTTELSTTATTGQPGTAVGDNRVALRLAEVGDKRVGFAAVGGLPAGDYGLVQFGAAMVGLNAVQADDAETGALRAKDLRDNVANRLTSVSGVNMDEEMANVILYQNAFSASARLVRVADEMLQTVIDMMR